MSRSNQVLLVTWMVCVIAVALICGWIEWLNMRAGHYLPRHGLEAHAPWRIAIWANEEGWRFHFGPSDSDGNPIDRELTDKERQQMEAQVKVASANKQLRDAVGSLGFAQYPLVIIAAVLTVLAWDRQPLGRNTRLAVMAVAPIVIAAGALAWYRGYFSAIID